MPIILNGSTGLITPGVTLGSSVVDVPSGSAPSYLCRAWVNFNGTSTVAIRASGNVSSITDNGTGDYTLNFTTAMPDANYSISGYCLASSGGGSAYIVLGNDFPPSSGSCRVGVGDISTGARDVAFVMFQVFR